MKRRFVSLDRHTVCVGDYHEPDSHREIDAIAGSGPLIPRGAGLSYVAASFGEGIGSIGMSRFNRLLAIDPERRWIEVEAGVSLGRLYDFLTPRGLTLPVQPGYPGITIGGCIAGNVHGKNQFRDGLFGDHVQQMTLFHPRAGKLALSPKHETALFNLTIGGMGLTGLILSARLSLAPLAKPTVEVEHIPFDEIDHAFALVSRLSIERDMAYAWVNLADLDRPGRGYVVAATVSKIDGAAQPPPNYRALDPGRSAWRPPILTRHTLPMVNRIYRRLGTRHVAPRSVPLFDFLFPAVGKERYFDAFGDRGFIEMQSLVPTAQAGDYAHAAVRLIRKHGIPIALATVRAFKGKTRLLQYSGSGFSFTIDLNSGAAADALLAEMDALNMESGAIGAAMKDSRLSARVVQRQYPEYGLLKKELHEFDPKRLFASELSRRLEL